MGSVCAQLLLLRRGRVLLARHTAGPFAGRWTGLIEEVRPSDSTPRDAAVRAAAAVGLRVAPGALRERAVFEFVEHVDAAGAAAAAVTTTRTVEHEFVARLGGDDDDDGSEAVETAALAPRWHALEHIPYADMPADDPLWYPHALSAARGVLRGRFEFRGRTLTAHSELRLEEEEEEEEAL
jgi:hypothetical protein